MKIIRILTFLILVSSFCSAQTNNPKDYFRSPLDIPIVLSGTFGELRSNHFHSGLDIKTQQVEGKKVFASAEGFVSRIKITHWGYGKALYITHPNGYSTVYAHLQKFSDRIEAFIKKKQYEKETFEIEVFPSAEELQIEPNEIVAYSGNTGGSAGPHLHFEIRDKNARPINPMTFGLDIKDTKNPTIRDIFAYPLDEGSHINNSTKRVKLRLIPLQNGNYSVESIEALGRIGFGIHTTDRQDLAANSNGVYNIQTFLNGNKNFELEFNKFSFSETKHLNRLIDYKHYAENKERIQKLFIEKNNPLSLYKNVQDYGYISVLDSTSYVYKIQVKDFKENAVLVKIPISGKPGINFEPNFINTTPHHVVYDQPKTFTKGNVSVYFPKNTFYEDVYLDFDVTADTLKIHKPEIPLTKNFTITYDISNYSDSDKKKIFIARIYGKKKKYLSYVYTKRRGNKITARTKALGNYTLAFDTEKPKIKPVNFDDGKWLSKFRYLKVKLSDDLSGIRNYRATVNGKWILMEYNPKKQILTYDFNDNVVTDTKNNLKIIVTDYVGNSATFEATFFRK
ncbi:MAG: M23 family metallopeptidase [Bacteroidia bacterium]|nr:M23 family metallopeptidase [Bacteroidia bacterium]